VGLEFLSRGAAAAVFIEKDRRVSDVIRRNVDELDFDAEVEVWTHAAESGLDRLAAEGRQFDLVFADPPYDHGLAARLLERLAQRPELLAAGGCVIVQHSNRESLPERERTLQRVRQRPAGDTLVSWYEPA
jgi:16S rRNA (guanine(966)-N(2))-methyltransferase RsmD